MAPQTSTDQWYTDYYTEKRYASMSMADYFMYRQARGADYVPTERHEISLVAA
jgi:hypothetical protein